MVGQLRFPSLCGPLAGLTLPDRSSSSVSRAVQDAWDVFWHEFGVVPLEVAIALSGCGLWVIG